MHTAVTALFERRSFIDDNMPVVTRSLLRKRAEHNEGMLSTLQEITLHQEELENINEVLGMTCRKIKILYLQNNIIPKMENLFHLKDLEYLNLALNNITCIEGLQNCEFLKKLDLTVNFIGFQHLKSSVEHLIPLPNLAELYLMGNPAQANWANFNSYVIAKLPQLRYLDGTEITRSMQIKARQSLPLLESELLTLFRKEIDNFEAIGVTCENVSEHDDNDDANEMTENTPATRIKIYKELAEQKKEKEDRASANLPKERDYEKEQVDSVAKTRGKESDIAETEVKQKNEGGWDFFWDEETKPGCVILDVRVAKFLDSSLIDVDVHPSYVSMVIKSKLLRLRLPAEIKVSESKCQRSKTTGALLVVMPKVNPKENAISIRGDAKARTLSSRASGKSARSKPGSSVASINNALKKMSLQEQMIAEALQCSAPLSSLLDSEIGSTGIKRVDVQSIVKKTKPDDGGTVFDFDKPQNSEEVVNKLVMEIS